MKGSTPRETEGQLREMRMPTEERVAGDVTCAGCGDVFRMDSGDAPIAPLARYVGRVLSGEVDGYCAECAEKGEEQEERRAEEEERRARRSRYLQAAGIPRAYRVDLEEVNGKSGAVVAAVRDWAAGRARGLVLLGDVGRGKTFLAGAAATERTWHGPVRWLSVPALLQGLRAGYGTDEQRQAASALTPVRGLALILDDLDKTRPTEAALETLFMAVDRWCSSGYPLLVTTNWDLERVVRDWPGSFGPAIASRLAGYCAIARVKGPDRRLEP